MSGQRTGLAEALSSPAVRRFIMFLAVGGLNTLVGYGLFALLILTSAGSTAALAGATILGVLFNFKSVGRLVFASSDNQLLPRFVGVYVGQFAINAASLHALEGSGMAPLLAQLLILPPLSVATFLVMQRIVFRPARDRPRS